MYAFHRAGIGLFLALAFISGQSQAAPEKPIWLDDCLVLGPVGRAGRSPIRTDFLEAEIVAGRWKAPKPGDKVAVPGGKEQEWVPAKAKDGALDHPALRGGYLYWTVDVKEPCALLLEAAGHGVVYVNGQPRAGDPYSHGYVRLPVALSKGTNEFLFQGGRGAVRAKLVPLEKSVFFQPYDSTLPDILAGEKRDYVAGLIVMNMRNEAVENGQIVAEHDGRTWTRPLPRLLPHSIRKVRVDLPAMQPKDEKDILCKLAIKAKGGETLDTFTLQLRVRKPDQSHKRTYASESDGSVQYYAVLPACPGGKADRQPALFLTLHGAGVEATGQADAYSCKSWGHIVAATNRRPYGFDWEDWGRWDTLEVLENAQHELKTDPSRVYLTGHSMGGHGTWHVGVTFPDRFAAIGPSAGWLTFWTYAAGPQAEPKNTVQTLLRRASSASDTLSLARNLAPIGVYVLHGDKDDNVPVREARAMKQHLEKFHRDLLYHEQPGAGHWWDASEEAGTDCVDWGPMFDFFGRRSRPPLDAVRHVEFTTASPGVSASCHWATIEAQVKWLTMSTIDLNFDPHIRKFRGKTDNVARLSLDLSPLRPGSPLTVELDGQKLEKIEWPASARLWLQREGDKWSVIGKPDAALKGPQRCGPFKEAFRNRMIFVYGTKGTKEESAWALAKARFDAETFWYRGNGSIDVVPDTAFDPKKEMERNVVLYGHADSNGAWASLLGSSPVQVRRGETRVGERTEKGDGFTCLFVQPRPGSERALVGVVSGSGLPGLKASDRLPYFLSGAAFPDCVVFGPDVLARGVAGVRAAGYFGTDWSVKNGEFAWQE